MGKPQTLLEGLCGHALLLGANLIQVEYNEGYDRVYANRGSTGISIAKYRSRSSDSRELRGNLYAAARRPVRTVLNGQRSILRVKIGESFGEDKFDVEIQKAPPLDSSAPASFTAKQGQYLAHIHNYTKIHGRAPAESEMQQYFRVSPPAVHDMIRNLERNGFIDRTAGMARSIRVLVRPEHVPPLVLSEMLPLHALAEGVWGIGAWHAVWNWTMGDLLGFATDGTPHVGLLRSPRTYGPDVITGGAFGLEGGLACTVVFLIAIGIIAVRSRRSSERAPAVDSLAHP